MSISWHAKVPARRPSSAQAVLQRMQSLDDELDFFALATDRMEERIATMELKMANVLRQLGSFWAQRFFASDALGCRRALRGTSSQPNQQPGRLRSCWSPTDLQTTGLLVWLLACTPQSSATPQHVGGRRPLHPEATPSKSSSSCGQDAWAKPTTG